MQSILDVLMFCGQCGKMSRVGDCEPDVDGDGSMGCPTPDCGGIVCDIVVNQDTSEVIQCQR